MLMKIFGLFALVNSALSSEVQEPLGRPVMVGGERDENNCLIGAGYNWCEASQSCVRHWETPCADNYDDCPDCLKRQRKGENIACPTNCLLERDTSECSKDGFIWCATLNKCVHPLREPCYSLAVEPGPMLIDPLPVPENAFCSHTECDLQCPNGFRATDRGCSLCECNPNLVMGIYDGASDLVPPPPVPPPYLRPPAPPISACPIPYEDCDNEFVCPKITEVTHCSEGGIDGYTTYQLSLIVKNSNVRNIYALFGNSNVNENNSPMIIPPAFQVNGIFGSNIGGVSQDMINIHPDSRYDSWLTVGISNGDPENKLANIGVPFETWNEETPLIIDNGAIFIMDPEEIIVSGDEYIIGQLTIPNDTPETMIINAQGKTQCHRCEESTWTELNIQFDINPPSPVDPNTIPEDCKLWYDGCNTCSVLNGVLGRCTRMMCFREDNPHCLDFDGLDDPISPGH